MRDLLHSQKISGSAILCDLSNDLKVFDRLDNSTMLVEGR